MQNGAEKIFIPIPNVDVSDDDMKIINGIMNMVKFGVEERLSVVNSYLRFLKRKQGV